MTIQQRLIAALEARGYTRDPRRYAGECIKLCHPTADRRPTCFIGSAGSLRTGATRTASIPVSDRFKRELLESVP